LYETLSANNPGVVVPPVPEKNPFGRFDDQFVRQRRFALEKCIQKIANHPVLGQDPDLKTFLESDTFALDVSFLSSVHDGSVLINHRLSTEKPILPTNEAAFWPPSGKLWQGPDFMKQMR